MMVKMMKNEARHDELIALLLGDGHISPEIKNWLETAEGQRELHAYRESLSMLDSLYGPVSETVSAHPVYYTEMESPVGHLCIAASDAGLVRVSFQTGESSFVAELRRRLRKIVLKSQEQMASIVLQLGEYFEGHRKIIDVPVDLSIATPFQRRVLQAALEVPPGQVISYGEIAKRIGKPKASRAVGQALGRNPIPIVIPCHRVVQGGGGLGGYTGGLAIKKKLLQLEGALPIADFGLRIEELNH